MTLHAGTHRLTVYSRAGCHLCDEMLDALRPECAGRSVRLDVIDVDRDPALVQRYGSKVPVLCVDGAELCHYHLDIEALRRALA